MEPNPTNPVIEQIREQYAADEQARNRARTLDDVPFNYEAIEPSWFTRIVCKAHPGAEVVDFSLGEPNDGSSNRRRVFLTYNDAGKAAGLPTTVFCKAAMALKNRVLLGSLQASRNEVDFFEWVRSRIPIDAPLSLHGRFDARSHAYVIVMEDLTDKVHFCDENTAMNRARAESMVEQLAILHAGFLGSPDLHTRRLPFGKWIDWWRLTEDWQFEHRCAEGLEASSAVVPSGLLARKSALWKATLASVERHRVLPETLSHTDPHFSNWYAWPDDRMGLCDWQFLCVGHWSRDLVFALTTALTVEQRREWFDDLIKLYVEKMNERGARAVTVHEALLNARQQICSALAFWTYTLRPAKGMPDMQTVERLLVYIGRMAHAVDDFGSIDSLA